MSSIARLLWISASVACGRVSFDPIELIGRAVIPDSLDFNSRCGAQTGTTASIDIANDGDGELDVFSASADNGFTVITSLPLTIAPGERATIDVQAPAAVIGTDVPGGLKTGTLTLTTNDALHTVDLISTVTGAELAVTSAMMPGNPLVLDFQGSSGACPNVKGAIIENTGDADANVMISAGSGVALTGFASGVLPPGGNSSFTLRAITNGPCSGVGTVTYVATGDICSTTPTVLQATFTITGSSSCLCS
jgi:hypothetical protein